MVSHATDALTSYPDHPVLLYVTGSDPFELRTITSFEFDATSYVPSSKNDEYRIYAVGPDERRIVEIPGHANFDPGLFEALAGTGSIQHALTEGSLFSKSDKVFFAINAATRQGPTMRPHRVSTSPSHN
ncbi:MAG: hypothetical protein P4L81_05445 [Candidatus Pacebacteria bacterium]|nr:hypothetical protein [Candidatus Paceibacterota bacterium]